MKKITEILNEKKFTISVELVPPRNEADPEKIFCKIRDIEAMVDFISVTKGAGGSLRGGTLPISYFSQERFGIHSIVHFVCRERTRQEIENDLIDLCYFNIKNILALRGDPPAGSNEPWNGDYQQAYLLARQIQEMNQGKYLPLPGTDEQYREGIKTDFCILVAGHPEDPIEEEIMHMKCKIDSGAQVIITQMIFTFEEYTKYVEALRPAGITVPIIPGIRPVTSIKQADSAESFFKVPVADVLKRGLSEHGRNYGLDYFADMITRFIEYGAPGVHLFILNESNLVHELFDRIKR